MKMEWLELRNDPNVAFMFVRVRVEDFRKKCESPSHFYRLLSQSNNSIGRMSNRNFTRRVLKGGGYFTQLMVNGEIHIYFLLMLKEGKNTEIIRSNFKMRTQKILPTSGVKVLPFSEIEDSEVSDFIINSSEMKMIQPIRETYLKGLKGQ